jgi:hypothetical protein
MFYGIRKMFMSRTASKAVKIKIYKTMAQPVVMYGSETWAMTEMDVKRVDTGRGKY